MTGRLTLKQVAEHFGVSVNTVSRALNDKYGVNNELRLKIKQYAADNNYIPNMFGRGLRGEKTSLIGVIIADTRNPAYFDEMIAIEQVATAEGYNILLCNSMENIEIEKRNLNIMIEKNVDGVFIIPCGQKENETPNNFSILKEFNIPFVLTHRYVPGDGYDFVGFDNKVVGEMALSFLLEKKRENILFLMPYNVSSSVRDRLTGYHIACSKAGKSFDDTALVKVDISSIAFSEKLVTELLVSNQKCDGIIAYNDLMAIGAMQAIRKLGLKIPEDIAILSVDDIIFASSCFVPLSTIHCDMAMLGLRAASILFDRIRGDDSPPKKEILRTYLVEREST